MQRTFIIGDIRYSVWVEINGHTYVDVFTPDGGSIGNLHVDQLTNPKARKMAERIAKQLAS